MRKSISEAATDEYSENKCPSEVTGKNEFNYASLGIKRKRLFGVIAFSGMFHEMLHNHNHSNCAVGLKIVSVNMSCSCQISPLVSPNPTEAYAPPQCKGGG